MKIGWRLLTRLQRSGRATSQRRKEKPPVRKVRRIRREGQGTAVLRRRSRSCRWTRGGGYEGGADRGVDSAWTGARFRESAARMRSSRVCGRAAPRAAERGAVREASRCPSTSWTGSCRSRCRSSSKLERKLAIALSTYRRLSCAASSASSRRGGSDGGCRVVVYRAAREQRRCPKNVPT